MSGAQKPPVELTQGQIKEGYGVEPSGEYILVWHHNNQIALLHASGDIQRKVQDVVKRKRQELKEVEEKTGWKPVQG